MSRMIRGIAVCAVLYAPAAFAEQVLSDADADRVTAGVSYYDLNSYETYQFSYPSLSYPSLSYPSFSYDPNACYYCPMPEPDPLKGNNGWGNGGDPTNPGSFSGGGISQGGPGADFPQDLTKPQDPPIR